VEQDARVTRFRSLRHRSIFLMATALLLAVAAPAQQFSAGKLVIDHPWARPTAAGMPTGVAYLSITNHGTRGDTLIGARTPVATRVEFHRTSFEGGMARMRPATSLVIEPGATLEAAPGGLHLMLVELRRPLEQGASVPLVLSFENAGEVTVQLRIDSQGEPKADSSH
jgi:copper(I)-binding protein